MVLDWLQEEQISVMQVTAHDVRQKLFLHHDDAVGAGGKRRLARH